MAPVNLAAICLGGGKLGVVLADLEGVEEVGALVGVVVVALEAVVEGLLVDFA